MKTILFLSFSLILSGFFIAPTVQSSSAKLKDIKFSGYITHVNSPSSFSVDDYRITVDNSKDIQLENFESKAIKFDPAEQIKVGTFIKFKGKYNTETLEATTSEIKIDMKQFRRLSQTVVLDAKPSSISRSTDGTWSGEILADARRIVINSSTRVNFKLNKSEEKAAKEAKKQKEAEDKASAKAKKSDGERKDDNEKSEGVNKDSNDNAADEGFNDDGDIEDLLIGSKPLQSLDDVVPGVYMTYKGKEDERGSLIADQVIFVKNEKTKDELKMWKSLRLKQKEAKKANAFDKLKVGNNSYKVLPEMEIQEYVNRLGDSLIPEYQKNLSDDDENKVPFVFRVIHDEGINAAAFPTGTVVINHDLFNYFENEAQLAFVISHEISHATQEHAIRQQNDKKTARTALFIGGIFANAMGYGGIGDILRLTEMAMVNGYARQMENQADRMGLSTMVAKGYDPREAPRTWKVKAITEGDFPTNLFWSSHNSCAERRSFLWLVIHNTYDGVNFSNLKKDSDEFQRIASIVKEKYPSKKKKS